MNRIAQKIRDARLKAKLTEKQLAKKCGLSAGYIMQIESGKKIVKEDLADKILKALGEKVSLMEPVDEPPSVPVKQPQPKPAAPQPTSMVEPNAQWADALSGVIKKYPIYDGTGKKAVDYKEIPVLGRKILGHHPDKILFAMAPDNSLSYKRIRKDDVLTLTTTKEIENDKIYLYEIAQSRKIGILRKEGNKQISYCNEDTNKQPVKVAAHKMKVIGKCIRVEFKV